MSDPTPQNNPSKIINAYPPNYADILASGCKPDEKTLYPFGEVLYNPSGQDIRPDILYHEHIHQIQQNNQPEIWWQKYLLDPLFRAEQEIEAYAKQVMWVKEKTKDTEFAEYGIEESAHKLSSEIYNLNLTFHEAKTLIRKRIQHYANRKIS